MRIGIGLPNMIPGVPAPDVLEWARKADAGPFSSLASLDRLVYPNYEALITLAVAAGATTRIHLMTTVLLAPLRNPAILAKQAASVDALSQGRLTLGLGVGGREDDFMAAGVSARDRGHRFDEQLALMRRVWSGEAPMEGVAPMGPQPARQNGPEVLIGGNSPRTASRAAQWDGYIAGGGGPQAVAQVYARVRQAWQEAGRQGTPRFVCSTYFGLGPDAAARAGAYIREYYAFAGPYAERIASGVPTTTEALKDTIKRFEEVGADELILWPCIADLDQVDRAAEVV